MNDWDDFRRSLDKHIQCNNIDRDSNATKLRVRNMFKALRNDLHTEMVDNSSLPDNLLPKMEAMMVKPTSWAAEGNRLLKMEMKANETCMDYIVRVPC